MIPRIVGKQIRWPFFHKHFRVRWRSCGNNVVDVLKERGFISESSAPHEEMHDYLSTPRTVYAGFDPTADSLHLGNLLVLVAMTHFQNAGHQAIQLVGGATGMVGDPSGRSTERDSLSDEELLRNVRRIQRHLKNFNRFSEHATPLLLNNYDWFSEMNALDFLRDVGKHFRMGTMLRRDSVQSRLGSTDGMSFTEFAYQILQGYDFLHLNRIHNCTVQIGGSDQWGNITSGIDLVRRVEGEAVYGVTIPLLTTATGEKFGKSEGNALWIDESKTTPFQLFQHLINTDDRDVVKFLKLFTFLSLDRIEEIREKHEAADSREHRQAHRVLARQVTRLVHGAAATERAEKCTDALFGGKLDELSSEELKFVFKEAESVSLNIQDFLGKSAVDVVVETKACASKNKARQLIDGGGLSINNKKINDSKYVFSHSDVLELDDKLCVIKSGKKKHFVIQLQQ